MVLGIIIGLFIGVTFSYIICKKTFPREKDYSELIKNTLYELNKSNNEENSKKKYRNKS